METLLPLIIQAIAGAAGGNAAGKSLKQFDLGSLGNTIAGAVGGGVLGQILQAVLTSTAGSGLDIGSILQDVVGGGAGGAILTVVVGLLRRTMAKS